MFVQKIMVSINAVAGLPRNRTGPIPSIELCQAKTPTAVCLNEDPLCFASSGLHLEIDIIQIILIRVVNDT